MRNEMWAGRAKKALVFALAIVATLATSLLALAPGPAEAAFPGTNGKIVFSSNRAAQDGSTDYEIYVMEVPSGSPIQLTDNSSNDREPAFSSDGSRIAFSRGGNIWVMKADGSDQANLTSSFLPSSVSVPSDPTFSPDGSKIAYTDTRDIWVMNADGGGFPTKLTNDGPDGPEDITPAWSPDGSKIAYARMGCGGLWAGKNCIFVKNADGSGVPTRLTSTDLTLISGDGPAWSPDGSKIAFLHRYFDPYSGDATGDIIVLNSDGSSPYFYNEIFGVDPNTGWHGGFQANPAFSPDGSKIAFTLNDDILIGNADGSGRPFNLTSGPAIDTELDWGPLSHDLSLSQSDSPDPVKVNNNLTYTLKVKNQGYDAAPDVVLTDRLPSGVTFVSASLGCSHYAGKVTCKLGSVGGITPTSPTGTAVSKTITVRPTAEDTIDNSASVNSSAVEVTYLDNNSDREGTQVTLNRAPVADDDAYVTKEDMPLTITVPGVLSDDTDADSDQLTVSNVVETTSGGTLTLNSNGSFTYTPNANFNGADAFSYTATDGTAESNVATVTMVVRAVNDAPNAADDFAQTEKDTPLNINVLANDRDPERDDVSITDVSDPAHGTAILNTDGTVRYAPDAGYTGSDPFIYTVSDGNGGTDTATVTVTVSDTTAPLVSGVTPQENATGADPGANISARFSEAMEATSVKGAFKLYKKGSTTPLAATVTYDATTKEAVLDPSTKLQRAATYKAVITTGAKDLAGNPLGQPKEWFFTVGR